MNNVPPARHRWSVSEDGRAAHRDDGVRVRLSAHGVAITHGDLDPGPYTIPWWVIDALRKAAIRAERSARG